MFSTKSLNTDTSDVNGYQAAGAVTVCAVVGGATLATAFVAPLPTGAGLLLAGGLFYAGHRANVGDDKKSAPAAQAEAAA